MTPKKSDDSLNKALYAAREEIIREMPEIITKIITKAKDDASYLHAKFLWNLLVEIPPADLSKVTNNRWLRCC